MTKQEAIERAGGTAAALARLLKITRGAVSKWITIPPLRVYQLRKLRPRWFKN